MAMRILRKENIEDIMIGSGFLGSGGGGSPAQGRMLVDYVMGISEEVMLAGPEEIAPSAWVAVVGGMGSPAAALEKGIFNALTRAFETLERAMSCRFSAVIPLELGSGNSIAPMSVAARKGIPIVDGDGAGRAIPQLDMTTYAIFGVPISPFTLANETDVSIVLYTDSPDQIERLARAITVEFGMVAGFATHAMQGEVLCEVAVPGTLSLAEKVGAALRGARQAGSDPIAAVNALLDGWILVQGTIAQVSTETKAGFDFGTFIVRAETGQTVQVDFKNENMIAWEGRKPIVMAPDMICCLREDGQPVTNVDVREGMKVAFIGMRAPAKWRSPQAARVFAPVLEKIGYAGPYLPIETLLTEAKNY
jgi:DUF917 family protein